MSQTQPTGGGGARPDPPKPQERRLAAYNQGLERLMGRVGRPVIDVAMRPLHEFGVVMQKPRGVTRAAYALQLRQHLGPGVRIEPLFPGVRRGRDLPVMADFFVVRWPGLDPVALAASPYDIAYTLQDATKSVSATPESSVQPSGANTCREPDSSPDPNILPGTNSVNNADWHLRAANVPQAWQSLIDGGIGDRGAGILVGHLDTGIVRHQLLEPRVDFNAGQDYLRPGQLPVDPLVPAEWPGDVPGHGTFSSSAIAAAPDTGTRFSGVAPDASLLPMRVTRNVVVGPLSYVSRAIYDATAGNADLISISLGGISASAHLHSAVNNATYNNVMVIAAAGQCVKFVVMPAALRNCVSVAGTKLNDTTNLSAQMPFEDLRDRLTLWSRSAIGKVSIAAPAKDIYCAAPDRAQPAAGGVNTRVDGPAQGTTFATAIVAGAAALWLRKHGRKPLSSRYQNWRSVTTIFKQILADTAYRPPGWAARRWWGPGVLDVKALLDHPLPPNGPVFPELPVSPEAFMQQHERIDVQEWFEDAFSEFEPQAVRAALRRLFPAATDQAWRERLAQVGPEALNRLAANAAAADEFLGAVRAEAAARTAEAAERAQQAARALADEASDRLRQAFGR